MRSFYSALLWLYPARYRQEFGREILNVIGQTAAQRKAEGPVVYALFVIAEVFGLISGAAAEWMAQTTARRSVPEGASPLRKMTEAIARHDFLAARAWSLEDLKTRSRAR
jgi:hypothetical protein